MNLRLIVLVVSMICSFLLLLSQIDRHESNYRIEMMQDYSTAFKDSVSDVGPYIAELEAQQLTSDIRYSEGKRLAVDLDILYSFYDGLSSKLGIFGDDAAMLTLMRHIPLMIFIEFDGYRVISPSYEGGEFSVDVGPLTSFYHKMSNNDVIYFNIDDTLLYYERFNNRFLEMDLTTLSAYLGAAGLMAATVDDLESLKAETIRKRLTQSMEVTIRDYNQDMSLAGLEVKFSLPSSLSDFRFSDVGFVAFIQGYPLPSGELFTEFAFGSSRVTRGKEYYGVIRSDGRHIAYETACGVPTNTMLIETLYGEKEAARKGYFVESCPY